ncbi:MAG: hypothetical protein JWM54_1160 [Acidobacteriaceae bacterium]|nr:hypothetical protein [Acidobacteriaceae bacterium]
MFPQSRRTRNCREGSTYLRRARTCPATRLRRQIDVTAGPLLQKTRIFNVLSEGPATVLEVSVLTGLPRKHCCAIMRDMWIAGALTRKPFNRAGVRGAFIYAAKGNQ